METHQEELVPQEEEDIEKAVWQTIDASRKSTEPIYASLADLLSNV
jgi:hypothetical protein